MKFDEFLEKVGDWGKFQKVKYALICLTYMLPPIMVYTYTFTAATPSFRCANPTSGLADQYNEDMNQLFNLRYQPTKDQCTAEQSTLSLKECKRCFIKTNQTKSNGKLEACHGFVFDKTNYQKTLVEEVINKSIFSTKKNYIFFIE